MILVLSGPGGAGKGTVIRRLVERDPRLHLSKSWTTRARRPGEDADAYTFVDRARFQQRIADGGFLEWATILDEYYGTPLPEVDRDVDVALEIDLQGARQVKARVPEVVTVLLVPPSTEVQAARMRARGDSEAHIRQRVELGKAEVASADDVVDATVVNDDLDEAVEQLAAIVSAARARFAAASPGEPGTAHEE